MQSPEMPQLARQAAAAGQPSIASQVAASSAQSASSSVTQAGHSLHVSSSQPGPTSVVEPAVTSPLLESAAVSPSLVTACELVLSSATPESPLLPSLEVPPCGVAQTPAMHTKGITHAS